MDVNGTHFHLLTGPDDWEPQLDLRGVEGLWWDRERASLSLLPKVLKFQRRTSEALLTPEDRRGADGDRFGNIFWIADDAKRIRLLPAYTAEACEYWKTEDLTRSCTAEVERGEFHALFEETSPSGTRLRGLAVTREHYLVVGTLEPAGLLVFDLHGGGPPSWLPWPSESPFAPFDLAAAPDGGVWVLDRDETGAGRLWALDRYFQVFPLGPKAQEAPAPVGDFCPLDASGEPRPSRRPSGVTVGTRSLEDVQEPVAIAALPDGSVLILGASADRSHSVIHRYRDGALEKPRALSGGILQGVLEVPYVKAHDFAFVAQTSDGPPDEVRGELTLVLEDGNQALVFGLDAFRAEFNLTIRPHYLPLRRFTGKALVARDNAVYHDLDERWYPVTRQPRRRYESESEVDGLIFDGKEPRCVWHRVLLDACIPDGTQVQIFTRAADERELLDDLDWGEPEPEPYHRADDTEIPFHQPFTKKERELPDTGTWELLLQNAQGRYIELRLKLSGNGRATPRIRALRIYYPRFSYLEKYLPAMYREDARSASFLDRYLANVEGLFSALEGRVARAEALLDTRTVPAEFLDWLAGWLGSALDPEWDDARRRLFIEHAELLFRWRGTQSGMRAAIRLAIEPCPDEHIFDEMRGQRAYSPGGQGGRRVRVVERFMYRDLPGVLIGDPTEQRGLSMLSVSTGLEDLGDRDLVSRHFRDFLRRRYAEGAGIDGDALGTLNAAWGTAHGSFDDIEFSPDLPDAPRQRVDWFQFVQRSLAQARTWRPDHGAYALHVRYQESMRRRYVEAYGEAAALTSLNERWGTTHSRFEDLRFPPVQPGVALAAEDWLHFIRNELGFTYAPVTEADAPVYREFLARRYRRIDVLRREYGLSDATALGGFDQVGLPDGDAMPEAGRPLHDWIQFVSLMLPIRRNAHRFTVLVPTEPGELPDSRAQRIAQVEAVVRREKPAHTDYEVKLFWALFQVGTARLGQDTVLGESARYVAIVLGGTYLGQGKLGHGHAWNAQDRTVLGRDRLPLLSHGDTEHE